MNKQTQTADTVLDKPEKFSVRYFGIKIRFGMKPLKLGTLIYIGRASAKIKEIPEKENILKVIGSATTNALPMAQIVAYAILNSKIGIRLWGKILAKFLMWRLTPSELSTLIQLTIKQSSVTDFFQCTVLALGISPIAEAVESKEEKQSGEKLPEQSATLD